MSTLPLTIPSGAKVTGKGTVVGKIMFGCDGPISKYWTYFGTIPVLYPVFG